MRAPDEEKGFPKGSAETQAQLIRLYQNKQSQNFFQLVYNFVLQKKDGKYIADHGSFDQMKQYGDAKLIECRVVGLKQKSKSIQEFLKHLKESQLIKKEGEIFKSGILKHRRHLLLQKDRRKRSKSPSQPSLQNQRSQGNKIQEVQVRRKLILRSQSEGSEGVVDKAKIQREKSSSQLKILQFLPGNTDSKKQLEANKDIIKPKQARGKSKRATKSMVPSNNKTLDQFFKPK